MTNVITIGVDELRKIVREEVGNAVAKLDAGKSLISSQEIMSLFHISRTTVWRWRKTGTITPVKCVGAKNLYRRSDVEKLIG